MTKHMPKVGMIALAVLACTYPCNAGRNIKLPFQQSGKVLRNDMIVYRIDSEESMVQQEVRISYRMENDEEWTQANALSNVPKPSIMRADGRQRTGVVWAGADRRLITGTVGLLLLRFQFLEANEQLAYEQIEHLQIVPEGKLPGFESVPVGRVYGLLLGPEYESLHEWVSTPAEKQLRTCVRLAQSESVVGRICHIVCRYECVYRKIIESEGTIVRRIFSDVEGSVEKEEFHQLYRELWQNSARSRAISLDQLLSVLNAVEGSYLWHRFFPCVMRLYLHLGRHRKAMETFDALYNDKSGYMHQFEASVRAVREWMDTLTVEQREEWKSILPPR